MIPNNQKTSLLVPFQLPAYIRDDPNYSTFVLFLQAYYEWLEQTGNLEDVTKNLLNYRDIDETTSEFINYFQNDFLPYFPPASEWTATNQANVIKFAREMYRTKGTPASYKFLFRVLYNSDVDIFNTKELVIKASAGTWYIPVYLNLLTTDPNWLFVDNLRVFGITSQAIATINAVKTGLTTTEVFVSDIQRTFLTGETVYVINNLNEYAYYDTANGVITYSVSSPELLQQTGNLPPNWDPLEAQVAGRVSKLTFSSLNQGLYYLGANTTTGYPGDPVVFYGGLSQQNLNFGALAYVSNVSPGSITSIGVANEGYGYTSYNLANNAYSIINIPNSGGATAQIFTLDPRNTQLASFVPNNSIYTQASNTSLQIGISANIVSRTYTSNAGINYGFANIAIANANTSLANAFSFVSFNTSPISAITVTSPGGGILTAPTVTATSYYNTDVYANSSSSLYANNSYIGNISTLGILAPIQILNGGVNYTNNDTIIVSGGTGYGAYANVTVNSAGSIVSAYYVYPSNNNPDRYPLGGLGYVGTLPNIIVQSVNNTAANASLVVPGILGQGAQFQVTSSQIGKIKQLNLAYNGTGYTSTPSVSLRVQDIFVNNLNFAQLPSKGDLVYQGQPTAQTWTAIVDSITIATPYFTPATTNTYRLRVYNYTGLPSYGSPIYDLNNGLISMNMTNGLIASQSIDQTSIFILSDTRYSSSNGMIQYGDGTATATAAFQSGLNSANGHYIDDSGFPSGYNVLQSKTYNNFTYELTLQKEFARYKDTLLNLLHPTGTQVIGRFAEADDAPFNFVMEDFSANGYPLNYITGSNDTFITMLPNNIGASNTITFNNIFGANIANLVPVNSYVRMFTTIGTNVTSKVVSVSYGTSEDLLNETAANVDLFLSNSSVDYTPPKIADGVITSSTSSNVVTGTGSHFTLDLLVDTVLSTTSNVTIGYIKSIVSNTSLILETNASNTVTANTYYTSALEDMMTDAGGDQASFEDSFWLAVGNVAYGYAPAGTNQINIVTTTNSYDIIDNAYEQLQVPINVLFYPGDTVTVNNQSANVATVDYVNNIVYLTNSLPYGANAIYANGSYYNTFSNTYGLISVSRNLVAFANDVTVFGIIGTPYNIELTTESGNTIITESGSLLLIN